MNLLNNIILVLSLAFIVINISLAYFSKEGSKRIIYMTFSNLMLVLILVIISSKSAYMSDNMISLITPYITIVIANMAILHIYTSRKVRAGNRRKSI